MTTLESDEQNTKLEVASKRKSKLGLRQKNWVLSFHIGFAALWTGTVISMLLIALKNQSTDNAEVLFALNAIINLLDDVVVIPAAIGSVVTATILCWQTNYGFFKFYWVIVKWILTTGLIIVGTFWLGPWGKATEAIARTDGMGAIENPLYQFDANGVLIGSIVQVSFLFGIIVISTLKPWGRRVNQ